MNNIIEKLLLFINIHTIYNYLMLSFYKSQLFVMSEILYCQKHNARQRITITMEYSIYQLSAKNSSVRM
jgi:hypothetical protein